MMYYSVMTQPNSEKECVVCRYTNYHRMNNISFSGFVTILVTLTSEKQSGHRILKHDSGFPDRSNTH